MVDVVAQIFIAVGGSRWSFKDPMFIIVRYARRYADATEEGEQPSAKAPRISANGNEVHATPQKLVADHDSDS